MGGMGMQGGMQMGGMQGQQGFGGQGMGGMQMGGMRPQNPQMQGMQGGMGMVRFYLFNCLVPASRFITPRASKVLASKGWEAWACRVAWAWYVFIY